MINNSEIIGEENAKGRRATHERRTSALKTTLASCLTPITLHLQRRRDAYYF